MAYYNDLLKKMKDDRNPDWEVLENTFRNLLSR